MSFDKEKAERNLAAIMDKMQNDTDILKLKEYHKLYKKEISIFRRSWAAAWLFMYYDQKEVPAITSRNTVSKKYSDPVNEKAAGYNKGESLPVIEIPNEESKQLFLSIGKNRRLFPREVISLIMTKANVAREDIGIIKILDNYSFIQVRDKRADDIIAALNGLRFRGRTLAVNYAKPKSSSEDTEATS